jgi:hypothetical protein
MTIPVVVPVEKDFLLFHDKIIQRGDIRFFGRPVIKSFSGKIWHENFTFWSICSNLKKN